MVFPWEGWLAFDTGERPPDKKASPLPIIRFSDQCMVWHDIKLLDENEATVKQITNEIVHACVLEIGA